MKEIRIRMIPHKRHKYATSGNYFPNGKGKWIIEVSQMPKDCRRSCVLACHEFVELLTTLANGIHEKAITAWDKKCLKTHPDAEPGDLPGCPYRKQHRFAEKIERMVAKQMGVKWRDYTKALDALWK